MSLLILAVSFVTVATLVPLPGTESPSGLCVFCGRLGAVDFLLNVALFVPFGVAACYVMGRPGRVVALGLVFSLAIEVLQVSVVPGRDASVGDLLANTLGTMVGALLALVASTGIHATGRLARRLAMIFALLTSALVVATGWLLLPVGVMQPLVSMWRISRPNRDNFTGIPYRASLNDKPLRTWLTVAPEWFSARGNDVTVTVTVGGHIQPTARQAIIMLLANHWENAFYLGQWKNDVVVSSHQVAQKLRFRPLLAAFEGQLDFPPNSPPGVTLEARSTPRGITLVRDAGERTVMSVPRTIGLGWTLILPWDVAVSPRWWFANAAWLGALVIPVAFFTFRSRRHQSSPGARSLWPLFIVVGILAALGPSFGMTGLSVKEWIGVAVGIASGYGLEKLTPTDAPAPLKPVAPDRTIQT